MKITETDKSIFSLLMTAINNPYGVAGLMGNLFAESSMNPVCITGKNAKEITGAEYADKVYKGIITRDQFIYDEIAFGLVQWRYYSRKANLHDFINAHYNGKFSSYTAQVEFMLNEIKTYKTVWNTLLNATSVKEASDIVMEKYEKPGNVTEAAKEKRASYGQEYYDAFVNVKPEPKPYKPTIYVRTTTDRVFIRNGNGKNYTPVTRIEKKGTQLEWVATAENGWHAVKYDKKPVVNGIYWISGEFTERIENDISTNNA